ncbi:MAG: MarR family EPS-associated transcriptional regulator [Gallionellaceae bacterium]|jgi:EPS-associated MarR family transcriptional regulator
MAVAWKIYFNLSILPSTNLNEESHLKVLRLLELNPHINQRDLSKILGISLGKTNYCIKALLDKGLIKMQNFRNNQNKLAYIYFLTPAGVEEKARITVYFLKSKVQEFERLRVEIDELYNETTQLGLKNSSLQQKIK